MNVINDDDPLLLQWSVNGLDVHMFQFFTKERLQELKLTASCQFPSIQGSVLLPGDKNWFVSAAAASQSCKLARVQTTKLKQAQ